MIKSRHIKIDIDGLDLLALKGCSKYLESSHNGKQYLLKLERIRKENTIFTIMRFLITLKV